MESLIFSPFAILSLLIRLAIPLLIFLASAYYLSKKTDLVTILLTAGSFARIISDVVLYLSMQSAESSFYTSSTYSFVQGFAFLGNIAFAVGFALLIKRIVQYEE